MLDTVSNFANNHPICAVFIAIPLIGWSARIVIALIRAL
jgi:hypothetical protein